MPTTLTVTALNMPKALTVPAINLYCAEHAQLTTKAQRGDLAKPEYLGEVISLRIKYGLSFDDVDLSVR